MVSAQAISLDRMVRAVEKVRERLLRAVEALNGAGVSYAVAGGNAVAAWVTTVDESAVRNTRDVDVLIRRGDLDKARRALEEAGFVYRHTATLDVFLDGPDAKARDAFTSSSQTRRCVTTSCWRIRMWMNPRWQAAFA